MYDLKSRGVKDYRLSMDRLNRRLRDPLEGTVGTNTVFRTRFKPVSSSPAPTVYTSGSVDSSEYELDAETGTVVFDSAPSVQPTMTYYWSNLTDTEVAELLFMGFHEMESRWPRRWKVVDSDGATEVMYPSEATEMNIVNQSNADPTCGSDTFSTSAAERKFLLECARYASLASKLGEAAQHNFMYREDRGITVDKRSVPGNIDIALKMADKGAERAMRSAQAKYYTDGAHLGEAQKQPGTKDYFTNFEWQTDSRDDDYRETYAGTG